MCWSLAGCFVKSREARKNIKSDANYAEKRGKSAYYHLIRRIFLHLPYVNDLSNSSPFRPAPALLQSLLL